MAIIPANYVPRKVLDYDAEISQFLGGCLSVGALTIPPPVLGCYPLLELIECKYGIDPAGCSVIEAAAALVIFQLRRNAVELVVDARNGGEKLKKSAIELIREHESNILQHYDAIVQYTLHTPWEGLDMLPNDGNGTIDRPNWYDAEWCAAIAGTYCMTASDTIDRVLWEIPLVTVGHMVAYRNRYEGRKGVGRKDSMSELDRMQREADERESNGLLHPWQIDHPERYGLSERQITARFAIVGEYQALLEGQKK